LGPRVRPPFPFYSAPPLKHPQTLAASPHHRSEPPPNPWRRRQF
jgi:hypothetical protein